MGNPIEMSDAVTETRRFSLRVMIFMLCAGLVVLVVVSSVGLSILQGRSVASQSIDEALARSHATQDYFQHLRGRQLELITELVAGDADLRGYIAEALLGGDDLFGEATDVELGLGYVDDILEERRQDIGFDMAMLVDPDGMLLTHSLRPAGLDESLADNQLVAAAIDEPAALQSDRLSHRRLAHRCRSDRRGQKGQWHGADPLFRRWNLCIFHGGQGNR
jgi:hypothetical protein